MGFFVTKLTETVYQESAPRVDADEGILYGVKLLGQTSRNGRRYTPEAMRAAVSLYNGRKSYTDHPDRESINEDRKFADWSGEFKNPRYVEGKGIFGDWHLRKSGEHFEGIIEAAQRFPHSVGLSHVAEGESRMDGDTEIIESIKEVFSVDLVTDPATTNGIFESKRKSKTVKAAIESLPESPVRKRLIEMVDSGYIDGAMPMEDGKDESHDPVSQFASLTKELIRMLGETLKALAMKKDTPPPPAPNATDPNANPEKQDEEKEGEEVAVMKKKMPPEFESMQRENAELKAKALLLESGREATKARISALAKCADEAEQKELLESWPEQEGAPLRSPPLTESIDASPENIRERFASLLGSAK